MDRILKNKSVVNFIFVSLMFSAVGYRIADNGWQICEGGDF